MGLLGSSCAAGFTISFDPITITTSVLGKSSLISSISKTISYGTLASARSTFIWPGKRPATGWMAKRTVLPLARRRLVNSDTDCCACATAMPYPGIITTESASFSAAATPSASMAICSPSIAIAGPVVPPKPPKITEIKLRFIALHII